MRLQRTRPSSNQAIYRRRANITRMGLPRAAGWRALAARGFADLSPPEAQHAVLELATDRAQYVGVVQDLADYPARSPLGQRVPTQAEVDALRGLKGSWRAVLLLDDERALKTAACLFERVFVLDPFYDCGGFLYAAWHDPLIHDEHSRRLADHARLLVGAAPLLKAGTAVLAPDHLPGSWSPRPGWRKPRPRDDTRQLAGWSMRSALVLLYWADRLDAVVCAARDDVVAALDVALGPGASGCSLEVAEPHRPEAAQAAREAFAPRLCNCWRAARRIGRRRRTRAQVEALADILSSPTPVLAETNPARTWRLSLGDASLPEPAMLLRRVLSGDNPNREPPIPRKQLKRRPLCLVPLST
jgi:hypothetical protein